MKPEDKPKRTSDSFEDPRLFVIIGEEVFPRTGLETAFVDYTVTGDPDGNPDSEDNSIIVGGEICACNKVRVVSCSCVQYTPPCSCDAHVTTSSTVCGNRRSNTNRSAGSSTSTSRSTSRSSGSSSGGGVGGCRCAPVH